ncbi:MAG: purine-binding chemotaxis protein CheW [Actinobacteria bacterium]|nr:MAG: purine-binding chemotaxis protein CheW [Actinomycetota bacterium]
MEATLGTGNRQYVLFHLGTEEYGLPIERVQSIIRYEAPTPVPHAPVMVEGVINLRGQVIPVVDLSQRLLGTSHVITALSRIVVAEGDSGLVGLAVDSVHEVATFSAEAIMPTPVATLTSETAEAFEGVANHGERLVILLDPEKALPRVSYGMPIATEEAQADV